MKFKVNDYITYPGHGIGRIVDVSTKELSKGPVEFYSIEIIGKHLKIMMPVKAFNVVGIKLLTGKLQAKNALKMPEFKRRYVNYSRKAKGL